MILHLHILFQNYCIFTSVCYYWYLSTPLTDEVVVIRYLHVSGFIKDIYALLVYILPIYWILKTVYESFFPLARGIGSEFSIALRSTKLLFLLLVKLAIFRCFALCELTTAICPIKISADCTWVETFIVSIKIWSQSSLQVITIVRWNLDHSEIFCLVVVICVEIAYVFSVDFIRIILWNA